MKKLLLAVLACTVQCFNVHPAHALPQGYGSCWEVQPICLQGRPVCMCDQTSYCFWGCR